MICVVGQKSVQVVVVLVLLMVCCLMVMEN